MRKRGRTCSKEMRVTLPGSARQLESTVLEPNPEQIYELGEGKSAAAKKESKGRERREELTFPIVHGEKSVSCAPPTGLIRNLPFASQVL